MELETVNKLFLELSQIATARTERELRLIGALKNIKEALEHENERGAIADTLWFTKWETLFDYIDRKIEENER